MPRWTLLVALAVILVCGSVAVAQDEGDATTIVVSGQLTGLTSLVEVTYGGDVFALSPDDGTVAVGFVESRTATADGATVEVILFGRDAVGWRALGLLTGDAAGSLAQAQPGDVVSLAVIGGGDD